MGFFKKSGDTSATGKDGMFVQRVEKKVDINSRADGCKANLDVDMEIIMICISWDYSKIEQRPKKNCISLVDRVIL